MADDDNSSQVIAFSGNTMVYESVKRFSIKALNELMRLLMENVDDALFEFAKKAETDSERNLYFEAMRELRLKRKAIESQFDAEIKARFDALITNKSKPKKGLDDGELSLVDQTEMEDKLAIDNMIAKSMPKFEDELYAVEERLKVILHRRAIKKSLNPLNPQTVCESFHEASEQLDIDIRAKLVFYKLFEQHVLANLDKFYRELNQFFVQKGVLPEFQAAEERMKQTTRFMADLRQGASAKSSQSDSFSTGESAPTAAPTASPDSNVLNILRQALGMPAGGVGAGSGASVGGMGAGVGASANAAGNATGSAAAGTAGTAGAGPGFVGGMVGAPMVTALTGMQSSELNFQPILSVNPADMKSQMAVNMANFAAANPASASEKQAIDMVSMLFDLFFEDHALPDPVKVLIGRLQIPILKVALMDSEFFNVRKHPARRLLDLISRVALGWGRDATEQRPLIEQLEKIVEHLLENFEEDVAIFEHAIVELQAFTQQESSAVEHNVANIQHQEAAREDRITLAEQRVDQFLDQIENNRDFSFAVADFLRGLWRKVLFDTLVSEGEESEAWRKLKKITSTLIWTLIPRHSETGRAKLLRTLPPLLKALSRGMELVHIDKQQQQDFFQVLVHEHAEVVKQTARNVAQRARELGTDNHADAGELDSDITQTFAADDPINEVQTQEVGVVIHNLEEFTESIIKGQVHIDEEIVMDSLPVEMSEVGSEIDDDCIDKARELAIDSWMEFISEDTETLHARLSWKSNVTGKCVFVDRLGHKVKTFTLYGLATEMRAGRARALEQLSFFDRAINSLMSGLRAN